METLSLAKNENSTIEINVNRNGLTYNQKAVFDLILKCVSNKVVLDNIVLRDWYLEVIVKHRNRIVDGRYLGKDWRGYNVYEKENEYERMIEYVNTNRFDGYCMAEPKQILKQCIGSLVMRGYLTAIPNIKLSETLEIENNGK